MKHRFGGFRTLKKIIGLNIEIQWIHPKTDQRLKENKNMCIDYCYLYSH